MRVETETIDGWLHTISADGELDAYNGARLQEAVISALGSESCWLIVDLLKVEYIDSVGLGILIGAAKRAAEKGGDLAVVCERAAVRRVFEVSGTAELLNVVEAMPEAVELLAAQRDARAGREDSCEGGAVT